MSLNKFALNSWYLLHLPGLHWKKHCNLYTDVIAVCLYTQSIKIRNITIHSQVGSWLRAANWILMWIRKSNQLMVEEHCYVVQGT